MSLTFRQALLAMTATAGLGVFAAAAPAATPPAAGTPAAATTMPPAGDPTATRPAAVTPKLDAGHAMAGKVEQKITDLHTRLQITPAQQPQWDQFTRVMRENAQATDTTVQRRIEAMPTMTAPQNMQSYATFAIDHAQETQKLVPAFQALYEVMTDSQKRIADQVFRDDARRGERSRRS